MTAECGCRVGHLCQRHAEDRRRVVAERIDPNAQRPQDGRTATSEVGNAGAADG